MPGIMTSSASMKTALELVRERERDGVWCVEDYVALVNNIEAFL